MATEAMTVRVTKEMAERIAALSEARDRSKAYIAAQAIEEYVEKQERYDRERAEDLAAWEEYMLTGKAIDGRRVEQWLEEHAAGKDSPCPK